MKRILLDTNIYGEMVIDRDLNIMKNELEAKKDIVVYGLSLIRKELRATPKNIKAGGKNLRIDLLNLYDALSGNHSVQLTGNALKLAEIYYKIYREIGGSKSKEDIIDDFIIVACASTNRMDIVVSEDEKSMLTENAIRAYKLANDISKERNPNFINYLEFKKILGGR